jgi:hypothetical protein
VTRRAAARRARAAVRICAACAGGWIAACGAPPRRAGGVEPDDAIVRLRSNVRDVQIYVDGRFVAPLDAAGGGIAVEPGYHRFELRRDDYFSSYFELELARAERRELRIELAPVLP